MTVLINTDYHPDNVDRLDIVMETGRVLCASVTNFYNIDEFLLSDIGKDACFVRSQTAIYYYPLTRKSVSVF